MGNPDMKAIQKKASSPEARAKAVATMKRRRAEREAAAFANAEQAAKLEDARNRPLLRHAKLTKATKMVRKARGIPLDLIPDPPKKQRKAKPGTSMSASKRDVVLALLKYLNEE